ncbi:MAG TPA: hypothetical protein PLM14_08210 [Candidatus Hydrogenedentes bacterium]|nr:hypothetical protein [Candidatus Hydrogenedentota bacterium]HQH51218.1 hypothetical protein [Candidatus Hydrogenedentota bacterium]HQM48327.1 hypothetical protein [Candidatus Hydrogenedentota bacterium]
MLYTFAKLDSAQLAAIQRLEREEGLKILALTAVETNPDMIGADRLAKLQELEKKLGYCLIAVR